ncbi:MAG: TonB-dependent receptor [Opitutaceae bacterium]|nr:TonB-dependent receptor [Opitutaceae bacterium]
MSPRLLLGALAVVCNAAVVTGRAAEPAVLTGTVSNTATGNLLEGARIEVPQLGLATLTDITGRYMLSPLPAGTHEVVVSYIGLDSARSQVAVGAGQRTTRDFDLTTAIYLLDQFKVVGEREGDASAITAQRNAENLKNVAATDSFGNLSNMNAGEVAIRLPGIAPNLGAGGEIGGFIIRGMGPGLNVVTMDGAMLTSQGAMGRLTNINNLSSSMYDQVELTKGHTPDKGADSLGGTINLKSRSPLSMREKRRVTYNFLARTAPAFTQQIPLREQRRTHGLANVAYQEVFDAFGGTRNLGVAVNLFSSEIALGWFNTSRDYQNTTSQPAYVWDYRTSDFYNHRRQKSVNVKADYRLAPGTKLTFLAMYVDHSEVYRRQYDTRAYTGSQNQNAVPNATTTSIVPGFTDRITTVRPVATSTIELTMTGPNNFFNRLRRADVGAEHDWGRWQVEYNARYTQTHINIGNGEGGVLVNRLTGTGWILDRTQSDLYPQFIPNGGRDFTDPSNYRPAPNGLANANNENDHEVIELRGSARYALPLTMPVFVKAGLHWREQTVAEGSMSRRWNYTGTTALPADPTLIMWDQRKTGRRLPQWEASHFIRAREVIDPTIWREDLYYREQVKYTGTRTVTETVSAGYAMAQGRLGRDGLLGRTGFLGGVRTEKTETESQGWVRARALSTAAQQAADPLGAVQRDYANNRREISGSYTKSFPSVHLNHDVNRNLKARLSWSTSFGRPSFNNALPNETPNENNQTLTINNPALLPQSAQNWDATLEYYFEPVGAFSVGWFHKKIEDYIVNGIDSGTIASGNDNGYNGEYSGFTMLRSANAGTATVQGWEFSYQQQFTFLPGWLKGLSGLANFTVLETHGDFGGTVSRGTGQVAGFVPRTGNASLSWRHRGFSTRLLFNYTGEYITSYTAASVGRNIYRRDRKVINLGLAYQVRPWLNLTLDIDNLTNAPQSLYRGIPDQIQLVSYHGTTISAGVNGRF